MSKKYQSLKITPDTKKLLNSSAFVFKPIYALHFNSPAEALIYQQLLYRAKPKQKQFGGELTVQFSYSRLAEMFGYSRKWMIETIKNLAEKDALEVNVNGRVNKLFFNDIKLTPDETPQNQASMLVFPELLHKFGLNEAIALQQLHIRHCKHSNDYWVERTFSEWHQDIFMYLSFSTVKRLFAKLISKNLILVQSYTGDVGVVNTYRVNYYLLGKLLNAHYTQPNKGF